LNPPARQAILENFQKSDDYTFREVYAHALEALATGGPGDQALIERAVKVVLARRLDIPPIKKLVDWVKKGGQPEDFGVKEPKETPEDPLAAHWPQLGPGFKVKYKRGGGYEVRMVLPDGQQAWNAAMAAKQSLQGQAGTAATPALAPKPDYGSAEVPGAHHPQGILGPTPSGAGPKGLAFWQWITASILWKQIQHIPGHMLNRLFPRFTRIFHQTTAGVQRMGVKNQVWATFITLFLILMAGSFLISLATRLLTGIAYRLVNSGHVMPGQGTELATSQTGPGTAAPRTQVEGQALLVPGQGTKLAVSQTGPGVQAGGKTLVVAVQGVSVKANLASDGVTVSPQLPSKILGVNVSGIQAPRISLPFGGNSTNTTATSKPKFREPYVPDELKQRVENDKNAALKLTRHFYEFSYKHNFSYWREDFDSLSDNYADAFDAQYFSKDRQDKFKDEKLYYDFVPKGDPILVKLSDTTDDIAVVGRVTLRGDAVYPGKMLWKKRMALVTTLYHNPDNSWVVIKVKETPAP
jgi:hypothetical protein